MKKTIFSLLAALLLTAGCQKSNNTDNYGPWYTADDVEVDTSAVFDTLALHEDKKTAEPKEEKKKSQTPLVTRSQLYSPAHSYDDKKNDTDKDDGMRGFDPTMEDDMPDNGMSRYTEVYDDEGWQ